MESPHITTIPDYDTARSHPRKKQWCFTLFYTNDSEFWVPDSIEEMFTYLVFQRESCPETGRTHLQGFICFSLAVRFTRAKELLMRLLRTTCQPHIQYIRGSVVDNINYCTKVASRIPGTEPVEVGERPKRSGGERGHATRLARELILAGKSPLDVALYLYVRALNNANTSSIATLSGNKD